MRKFNINVNGTSYEVEVEEIGGGYSVPVAVSAPAVAPVAAPAAAPVPAEKTEKKSEGPIAAGEQIKSPMPGSIVDIKCAVGQSIAEGDILVILEAMKMENEIMAPRAGKIVSVNVGKGETVDAGQVLVVIA